MISSNSCLIARHALHLQTASRKSPPPSSANTPIWAALITNQAQPPWPSGIWLLREMNKRSSVNLKSFGDKADPWLRRSLKLTAGPGRSGDWDYLQKSSRTARSLSCSQRPPSCWGSAWLSPVQLLSVAPLSSISLSPFHLRLQP